MVQLATMLKKELNRILQDKSSTVIDLGDKRVLITTIETNTQYDLDNDLDDPEIADAVAKGYEDYKAGRIVEPFHIRGISERLFKRLSSALISLLSMV